MRLKDHLFKKRKQGVFFFLYIVMILSLVLTGCQSEMTATDNASGTGGSDSGSSSNVNLETVEDYSQAITAAFDAENPEEIGRIFDNYRSASRMTKTDDDTFTSAVSVALDTKVQDMLMHERGAEARDFVVALRQAAPGIISDMYLDYATAPPDDPQVIIGRDTAGEAFATIRSITYVFYSFDGENYKPYEEGTQIPLKGQRVLYTYAKNPFENESQVVERSLISDQPWLALGDTLMDEPSEGVTIHEALTYYMKGMSRARFYLEATQDQAIESGQNDDTDKSDIIVDQTEKGLRGETAVGNRHMTVDFTIDDSEESDTDTARKLMAYYRDNDLYTTMLNYGLTADRVFEITDSAIMTAILQDVSSDDPVITQIDPSETSKLTVGILRDGEAVYLLIRADENPPVIMDASFQKIDDQTSDTLRRRFSLIVGD